MSKPLGPDDPMELTGAKLEGDVELMIDSIVEEYAGIGWGETEILRIFSRPFFQSTYNLARAVPPGQLLDRVRRVLGRCGVVRVAISEAEHIPEDDHSPDTDFVQLQPRSSVAIGDSR